jgi:hypothetical protein
MGRKMYSVYYVSVEERDILFEMEMDHVVHMIGCDRKHRMKCGIISELENVK